jgi:hypothetical protein
VNFQGPGGINWKFAGFNHGPTDHVIGGGLTSIFHEKSGFGYLVNIEARDLSKFYVDVSPQLPLSSIARKIDGSGSSVSGSLGSDTGLFSVVGRSADQSQLPVKQPDLASTHDDEPERKEASGVVRNPIPETAFLWMSVIFVCSIAGGLLLGWRATR